MACLYVQLLGWYLGSAWLGVYHCFPGKTCFCTSLSRYSHLISASGNSLLLPSVSPSLQPRSWCTLLHRTQHPRSGESPRGGTLPVHAVPPLGQPLLSPRGSCPAQRSRTHIAGSKAALVVLGGKSSWWTGASTSPGPRCVVQN